MTAVEKTFKYHKVQVFKGEENSLGAGSYGTVYKGKCDDLPCAAKILHPTLFNTNDTGSDILQRRFQLECLLLSEIKHPNIVQYLGTYKDPDSGSMVLLMELLDENLTRFLDRSVRHLQYSVQVDICHDIALAVAYLHSNNLIHRDLSSNNVLMIAGRRAKVTDFGMSKLNPTVSSKSSQTYCPGTEVYMPPEALKDPPSYCSKIDCFSLGPLMLQVLTHLFPKPGPRTKEIPFPNSPTGTIEMPVLETERRNTHIELVDTKNPLLAISISCLHHNPQQRPSAQCICNHLEVLKKENMYILNKSKFEECQTNAVIISKLNAVNIAKERELLESLQKQGERMHLLETEKKVLSQDLITAETEIKQLTSQIEEKEEKIKDMKKQVQESMESVTDLQHTVEQQKAQIKEYQRQLRHPELEKYEDLQVNARKPDKKETKQSSTSIQFKWTQKANIPIKIVACSYTEKDDIAYILDSRSPKVFTYNKRSREWSSGIPDCPFHATSLVCVNNMPTAIGGLEDKKCTSKLLSLVGDGATRRWIRYFPPMLTKRSQPVATCWLNKLVVAGGSNQQGSPSEAVEIMDTKTKQWFTTKPLPFPILRGAAVINRETIYIACYQGEKSQLNKIVMACRFSELADESDLLWYTIADMPAYNSALASVHGHLLGIGGSIAGKRKEIYSYNVKKDRWDTVTNMSIARSSSTVIFSDKNEMLVLGGSADNGPTDQVEIAKIIKY